MYANRSFLYRIPTLREAVQKLLEQSTNANDKIRNKLARESKRVLEGVGTLTPAQIDLNRQGSEQREFLQTTTEDIEQTRIPHTIPSSAVQDSEKRRWIPRKRLMSSEIESIDRVRQGGKDVRSSMAFHIGQAEQTLRRREKPSLGQALHDEEQGYVESRKPSDHVRTQQNLGSRDCFLGQTLSYQESLVCEPLKQVNGSFPNRIASGVNSTDTATADYFTQEELCKVGLQSIHALAERPEPYERSTASKWENSGALRLKPVANIAKSGKQTLPPGPVAVRTRKRQKVVRPAGLGVLTDKECIELEMVEKNENMDKELQEVFCEIDGAPYGVKRKFESIWEHPFFMKPDVIQDLHGEMRQ